MSFFERLKTAAAAEWRAYTGHRFTDAMADGSLAEAPIALAEVQAYAFAAYCGGAELASALGRQDEAVQLQEAADRLKQRFESAFWLEDRGTYALALDAGKRPCSVRASNAGHVLLAGLASPERARRVAETLMSSDSFSGWGIRTLAEGEPRYNPIAYHNGTIWPQDNALIAMGLSRYGLKQPVLRLLQGLFDAAQLMTDRRLPELFCGFPRRPGTGPTSYPVACSPQAWASAAVFAVLGAALGISFAPARRQIRFSAPQLPSSVGELRLSNLRLGEAFDHPRRRARVDVHAQLVGQLLRVERAARKVPLANFQRGNFPPAVIHAKHQIFALFIFFNVCKIKHFSTFTLPFILTSSPLVWVPFALII